MFPEGMEQSQLCGPVAELGSPLAKSGARVGRVFAGNFHATSSDPVGSG